MIFACVRACVCPDCRQRDRKGTMVATLRRSPPPPSSLSFLLRETLCPSRSLFLPIPAFLHRRNPLSLSLSLSLLVTLPLLLSVFVLAVRLADCYLHDKRPSIVPRNVISRASRPSRARSIIDEGYVSHRGCLQKGNFAGTIRQERVADRQS